MAGFRHFRILAILIAMMMSACTCSMCGQPVSESAPQVAQRSGLSLPTRKPRHPVERPEHAAAPTPVPGTVTLPTPGEAAVPDDFPSDVPILKDSKVFAVQKLAGQASNVLFRTDKPAKEVHAYYRKEMQTGGWNMDQEFETPEHSFMSFKKGKVRVNMTINKDPKGGNQVVGIMYQEEKDLPFPEF